MSSCHQSPAQLLAWRKIYCWLKRKGRKFQNGLEVTSWTEEQPEEMQGTQARVNGGDQYHIEGRKLPEETERQMMTEELEEI